MLKRILILTVAASLTGGALLIAGAALIDRINSVQAAGLQALVLGESSDSRAVQSAVQQAEPQPIIQQDLPDAQRVDVARLAADETAFHQQVVQVEGMITQVIQDDLFILNDGTGQIVIDLDDDFDLPVLETGMQVLAIGHYDSLHRTAEIDACRVVIGSTVYTTNSHCEDVYNGHMPIGSDDGTADQGSGDMPGNPQGSGGNNSSSSDDDGTDDDNRDDDDDNGDDDDDDNWDD